MELPPLIAAIRKEGLEADLPEGYRWGRDAMEQFEVGKRCATTAILALLQALAADPPHIKAPAEGALRERIADAIGNVIGRLEIDASTAESQGYETVYEDYALKKLRTVEEAVLAILDSPSPPAEEAKP